MRLFTARILSLSALLVALPLLSIGTTNQLPLVWWLGLLLLGCGALIPPALRFVPLSEPDEDERHEATDLAESSRVC